MEPDGGKHHEVAQESFPDDLDQSPEFDPTDPEPIPQDDLDQSQSWGAGALGPSRPAAGAPGIPQPPPPTPRNPPHLPFLTRPAHPVFISPPASGVRTVLLFPILQRLQGQASEEGMAAVFVGAIKAYAEYRQVPLDHVVVDTVTAGRRSVRGPVKERPRWVSIAATPQVILY